MGMDRELIDLMERIQKSIDDTRRVVSDIAVGKANFLMMAYYLVEFGQLLEGLLHEEEFASAESSKACLQRVAGVLEGIYGFTRDCKSRSRILLLYKCNELVLETTKHFRELVECLSLMLQENAMISPRMNAQITEMQSKLRSALFYAEPEQQKIAEEINACLAGNQSVEGQATGLLRRIAQILSVQPYEAAELKKELQKDLEADRIERGLYALLESAAVLDDVRKLASEDSSACLADDLAIPSSFFCPITGQIMEDPVMLAEAGYTYERYAITEWFERGHTTCPDTGKVLESLELVPNLVLRQNMEEVFERRRHKTMLHALHQIRAQGSPAEVEEAVNTVKQLMDVHPKYKRLIVTLDGIQPLVGYLKPAVQHLKERIFWILYCIAALGDEYKSSIIEAGAVPILLRLLHRNPAGNGGPVQLLWEISKTERGRAAILAEKASVVVVASAFNLCTNDQKLQAEQLLYNLCEHDKAAIVQAASSGIFGPLVSKLISGDEALQLEMTESICTIDLNGVSTTQPHPLPPTFSLLCHLAEDRITRQAIAVSQNMVNFFVRLLEDPMSLDEREAILGILSALAKIDETKHLMVSESHLLEVSMDSLRTGTPKMKECAAVVLSKLTDHTLLDKNVLLNLAKLGMIPLLIDLVRTGSERAKQHAAVTLGHLSMQTPSLTERQSFFKKLLARLGLTKYKICKVHAGKCSSKGSLCLVESEATSHLINMIRDGGYRSALRAIEALFTLVESEDNRGKGVDYLMKSDIISLLVQVVGKNEILTEKAVMMLERIYKCRKYRDRKYAEIAKSALYTTMATGNAEARRYAANALMHLGMMPKSSTYTQTG